MTTEERFERIEHITAGIAEERRKDREEFRQLWRDTQRQINELSTKIVDMGEELREADRRLEQRIEQLAAEGRAQDKRLGDRIEEVNRNLADRIASMVSAIVELSRGKSGD